LATREKGNCNCVEERPNEMMIRAIRIMRARVLFFERLGQYHWVFTAHID